MDSNFPLLGIQIYYKCIFTKMSTPHIYNGEEDRANVQWLFLFFSTQAEVKNTLSKEWKKKHIYWPSLSFLDSDEENMLCQAVQTRQVLGEDFLRLSQFHVAAFP